MTLRKKVILYLALSFLGLLISLSVILNLTVMRRFDRIDEQNLHRDILRLEAAVGENLKQLNMSTRDYSAWDDTCLYVSGRKPDYPKINFNPNVFVNLSVNVIVVADANRRLVFSGGYDLKERKIVPMAPAVEAFLKSNSAIYQHQNADSYLTGLVVVGGKALILASRPIITSDYQGPIRGTMIMMRYLDQSEIKHLSDVVQLSVHGMVGGGDGFEFENKRGRPGPKIAVKRIDRRKIVGAIQLEDIEGRPAYVFSILKDRVVYGQGREMFYYLLIVLTALFSIVGFASLRFVDQAVLSRLTKLKQEIGSIDSYDGRVTVQQEDELSKVGSAINELLESLVISKHMIRDGNVRYQHLLEAISDMVWVLNGKGVVLLTNSAGCRGLGCSRESLQNHTLIEVYPGLRDTKVYKTFQESLDYRRAVSFEDTLTLPTGSAVPFEISIYPVAEGILCILRDISRRKEAEERLIQTEKMSAMGRIAAGVAHEINNPLGLILGFAQSALQKGIADANLEYALNTIQSEAIRCKNCVQYVLSFSRHGGADQELVDMNAAIQGTLTLVEAQAKVHHVKLTLELAPALPLVRGNKNHFQQIVINLANNAVDAMDKGGELKIITDIQLVEGSRFVRVRVSDTGHGINPETLSRIYDPFFTTKPVGHGTGLGLNMVNELVKKHSGRIHVDSHPGKTVFQVMFAAVDGGGTSDQTGPIS